MLLCMIIGPMGHTQGSPATSAQAFNPLWSLDRIWDDGLAEVAIYEAERVIYGKSWPHEETRILVAEPMETSRHVKAEPPYAGKSILPVLKYNIVTRVQTKNYPYQLMSSLFIDRSAPERVVKATFSSQEWCGQTFKDLQLYHNPPRFTANSYWAGQAIIDQPLEWAEGTLLEDQLAVSLRALSLAEGEEISIRMLPSQIGNRAPAPQIIPAVIQRLKPTGELQAGSDTWDPGERVVYEIRGEGGFEATYEFAIKPPHVLLQYAHSDGRRGTLKSLQRRAYWKD